MSPADEAVTEAVIAATREVLYWKKDTVKAVEEACRRWDADPEVVGPRVIANITAPKGEEGGSE